MTRTVTAPSRSTALRLSVLAAVALLAGPVLSQTPTTPAAAPATAAAPAPAVAGPFTQAPLPYAEDALEPVIDTQTMQLHWGKHHRAYYDALNRAAGNDAEVAKLSLADLQGQISRFPAVVRNNGGGAWNHDFFWQSMAPVGQGGEPSAELLAAIERDLGGMEKFQEAFNAAGTGRFGSGWVWLIEQDGKLVPVHQTAEYKEALQWMRKIYEDGLVRPDWATVDTSTWEDGCKKGEAGCFLDTMDGAKRIWNYFTSNNVASVVDPSTTATMTMVGPIAKDANSEPRTLATSGYNGFYLITKSGAKTEEDLKNCLTFLDKMNDDPMLELADYGIEGISYDLNENGNVVLNPDYDASQTPNCGLNQAVAYIPNMSSVSHPLEKAESQIESEACQEVNEKYAVFNPALGYLANSATNAEVGTDIEQIIDDARTQYICGQIDDAGLDDAAQQWLDRGGAQLVEEVNELYAADTNK